MRTRRSILPMLGITLLLASCASDGVRVSVAFDPLARFPASATWTWNRDAIRISGDPRAASIGLQDAIEQIAEEAFTARGYSRASDPLRADYQLSYHLQITTFVAADASSSTAVLSFLLVESKDERRVWTGWGRSEFFIDAPEEERRARLGDAMARMLEDFPPRRTGVAK